MSTKPMSENAKTVLNCLKENYGKANFTYLDIANATGIPSKSVNALLTHSLGKRDLIVRTAFEVTDAEGKVSSKNAISLTDKGLTYDADAEVVEATPTVEA